MHHIDLRITYEQTPAGWVGHGVLTYEEEGKREEGWTEAFPTVEALREYLTEQIDNLIETISLREPTLVERTWSAA